MYKSDRFLTLFEFLNLRHHKERLGKLYGIIEHFKEFCLRIIVLIILIIRLPSKAGFTLGAKCRADTFYFFASRDHKNR